jgi:hypothetical protein
MAVLLDNERVPRGPIMGYHVAHCNWFIGYEIFFYGSDRN